MKFVKNQHEDRKFKNVLISLTQIPWK